MAKTYLMLPQNWGGEFRRTIRDEDGKPVQENGADRVLKFQPGKPIEVSAEDLETIRSDVGTALHFAKVETRKGEKGTEEVLGSKIDGEATRKFVEETKRQVEEQKKRDAEEVKQARLNPAVAPQQHALQHAAPAAKAVPPKRDLEPKGK